MTPAPSAVPLARRSGLPSLRAAFEHAARPLQDGEPMGDDVLESLWRIARAIGEDEASVARPELQAALIELGQTAQRIPRVPLLKSGSPP